MWQLRPQCANVASLRAHPQGVGLNIVEDETASGGLRARARPKATSASSSLCTKQQTPFPTPQVLGLVLGSPAALAGMRQGDELTAVDGASVRGRSAFEAASSIQARCTAWRVADARCVSNSPPRQPRRARRAAACR